MLLPGALHGTRCQILPQRPSIPSTRAIARPVESSFPCTECTVYSFHPVHTSYLCAAKPKICALNVGHAQCLRKTVQVFWPPSCMYSMYIQCHSQSIRDA